MAACFMIKNPQDASIYITGLPVNNSWPTTTTTSNGATNPESNNNTAGNGQQPRPAPGSPEKRYCPVLAVTRRSFQGHLNPLGTPQTSLESPGYKLVPPTTDTSKVSFLRENISKSHSAWTFGKPVPPSDILKSRSAFMSSSAAVKSRSSFLTKSKVDLRTGFMRLLSRPTPGELDLKYHRESQENSAKGRRGRDTSGPDPDKLSMTQIMRMLKSKSETEKRKILDSKNADRCQEPNTTTGPEGDGGNDVNMPTHSSSRLQKSTSKALSYSRERCDVVGCEPPLVSSRNREHKLRLQALYSQHHQCQARGTASSEITTQGRTWRDHDRRVVDRISQRLSPPRHDVLTRVNNLSLESLDDDGASCLSESCSDCWSSSRSSDSGDRNTPRSTAALLLQQNRQRERHHCRTCTGGKGREHRRSTRPARHFGSSGTHPTTNSEMDRWDSLEPSHHRVAFAEYINIIHPMRPPANSPVSMASEDEYELMNMDDETDQWSTSYRTKGASSIISGLVKGKVRIESDGESKAKINIFLPQMK